MNEDIESAEAGAARGNYEPSWDKAAAHNAFKRYGGRVWKRPNGVTRYTLIRPEEVYCGWGVRVRAWPQGSTYVLCANAMDEEHWQEVKP